MSDWIPPERPGRRWGRWFAVGLGGVVGAALIAVFIALMLAQAADDRAGCGSVDPTDPANYSTDYIENDTPSPVVIDECRGTYCRPKQGVVRLQPGRRVSVNAGCAEPANSATSWRVSGPDGHVAGFITIVTPWKTDGLVFAVSAASPRRGTAATPTIG